MSLFRFDDARLVRCHIKNIFRRFVCAGAQTHGRHPRCAFRQRAGAEQQPTQRRGALEIRILDVVTVTAPMRRAPDALIRIGRQVEKHLVEHCARHLPQFVLALNRRKIVHVQKRRDADGEVRIGMPLVKAEASVGGLSGGVAKRGLAGWNAIRLHIGLESCRGT